MQITTIKLHKNTKDRLDRHKTANESYDDVVQELIETVEQKDIKNKLIEYYQKMGKTDLELLNEWEAASTHL